MDSDGLDGLSMRKLGAALDVEAMTLYHYLPSKAALLDGLVEWVLEHATTAPAADGLPWDETLRRYAETLRATLLGHPGVLPLFFTRPAVTPQTLKAVERGLRVLSDAGFALPRAADMINALNIFVVGHAMAEVGTAELAGGAVRARRRPWPSSTSATCRSSPRRPAAAKASMTRPDSSSPLRPFCTASPDGRNATRSRSDPGRPPGSGMAAGQGSGLA